MNHPRQTDERLTLPDFKNFGVMLRILLGVNLLAFGAALAQSNSIHDCVSRYISLSIGVQPPLLLNILALALFRNRLFALPVRVSQAAIVLFAGVSAAPINYLFVLLWLDEWQPNDSLLTFLLAALAASILLYYFELRARAYSPALTEARLQALTARIRPHFLFNSLNAVLSLIRDEPARAEHALEELADLFRVMMRDHRELLPLADELALCRQYLDLEKLRLGERLDVVWDVPDPLPDIRVPQLMIQPLLENAVYYGIEPAHDGGSIRIRLDCRNNEARIVLSNPCAEKGAQNLKRMTVQEGNHMALANIRERLALHYDLEARLETEQCLGPEGQGEYRVNIILPCRSVEK